MERDDGSGIFVGIAVALVFDAALILAVAWAW